MSIMDELRAMPDIRRLAATYIAVAVLWTAVILAIFKIADMSGKIGGNLSAGDQIISTALAYRAEAGSAARPASAATFTGDPLSVLSEIVSTLGMRDRMTQLQSNISGISMQFEKIYGDEMRDFLTAIDSRGLKIKNGEIRAMPSGDERLLNATLLLEAK